MTCEEIRERLDDFVDGETSPAEAAAIRAHVDSCVACAAELAALESLREATAELAREIEPATDLWSGIEATLDRMGEDVAAGRARVIGWSFRKPRWSAAGFAWRAVAAAAVVVLVGVGIHERRTGAVGWEVTAIEGAPVIGARDVTGKSTLRRGEWLETDASSRARVDVADIGHVTVGPATAIRLKGSSAAEHRIELARGEMSAFIWAPPRLFFVETPSGVAEDLGCRYDLAVDEQGNGYLEVTLGFVSFERDGREVIVPAGSRCELRAAVGPGTPYLSDAEASLRDALARVDFGPDGDVDAVLAASSRDDVVTLWHLIPRTEGEARERVVDRLAGLVPLPEKATRAGVLALDARMLERWWENLYPNWSHWNWN